MSATVPASSAASGAPPSGHHQGFPAKAAASSDPAAPPATAPPEPPKNVHSTRADIINHNGARILCVADVRGAIGTLNDLAAEHRASAIIHTGDFGFYQLSSLPNISDRTLRHLVQYSSLIPASFRSQLLAPGLTSTQIREMLEKNAVETGSFGLSDFPKLLSGELRLNVPVYTVWGACEDVDVLEKIRLAAPSVIRVPEDPSQNRPQPTASELPSTTNGYSIPNLCVLDEATSRVLVIGGVRLRLFGLGGAVVGHKLFDTGSGQATIAGTGGTMWTTVLQIGELIDTAMKVYDPSETRLLVSHASPGREGLLMQLCLAIKADLTVSAGLHFRYGISYNEFAVQHDAEAFRGKLEFAKNSFNGVWDTVKTQVESVIDPNQRRLLDNALAVCNRLPSQPAPGGAIVEEVAWKNCWNWNLPDAAFGSLVLDIRDGRVGSEMKSQGFNFAYRQNSNRQPQAGAVAQGAAPKSSTAPSVSTHTSGPVSTGPNKPPVVPTGPRSHPPAPSSTPAGQPSATPRNGVPTRPQFDNTSRGNSQFQQSRPPSGPGTGGFAARNAAAAAQPAQVALGKGGWGASVSDSEKKADVKKETASTASSATPAPAPADKDGPAPAPSKPSTPAPSKLDVGGKEPKDKESSSNPTTPRGPSGRHGRQNQHRTASKDEVSSATTANAESSGGENVNGARSPPGTSSGPDSGRGRGGRGGKPRGGGGKGRGGRADSGGPGGGGGEGTASSSTPAPPSTNHKAGAANGQRDW
ncbi:hypothetical protein T439DRAFT_341042 [Meredithblackwellia eburnea MCA 4105]